MLHPYEFKHPRVSMDALFGLCRKRSAGVSVRKPLFEGVFFEDQAEVDSFVANYESADKPNEKVVYIIVSSSGYHYSFCCVIGLSRVSCR